MSRCNLSLGPAGRGQHGRGAAQLRGLHLRPAGKPPALHLPFGATPPPPAALSPRVPRRSSACCARHTSPFTAVPCFSSACSARRTSGTGLRPASSTRPGARGTSGTRLSTRSAYRHPIARTRSQRTPPRHQRNGADPRCCRPFSSLWCGDGRYIRENSKACPKW